ncbi:MAG: ROK family protein [Clostridia bacterium]|nr:ROK family protein [Clostridia bacterium]
MARIGVDIGGTSVKIGVVKGDKVLKETSIKSSKAGFDKVVSDICDAILTLCKKEEVEFIGVGTRGLFENGKLNDRILKANDFDITGAIKKRFKNAKVLVTNDANAAAICELNFGHLKGSKCGALITYGTGVGCGIVINGKLFEGAHKNGGEIGRTLMGITDLRRFTLSDSVYES